MRKMISFAVFALLVNLVVGADRRQYEGPQC